MMKLARSAFLAALLVCFAAVPVPAEDNLPGDNEFPTQIVSLDLKDMDIIEALKYIAAKTNLNIIPTKEVTGRVSLNVDNVSLKDVFDIILRSNNLAYEKRGSIFNVMSENEYKSRFGKNFYDSRISKVFRLKYAIPDQAYNLLNTMKSEIGKVLLDPESGVLLVVDTPERVSSMETTLAEMDQKGVIKAFNLKYARAKDVEEQLKSQLDLKKVGSIKADERTNEVIVQTLPERMEDISRLIAGLDQKTRQILIDAKIIQVKLDNELGSGVEWEGLFNLGNKNGLTYLGSTPFASVQAATSPWRSRAATYQAVGNVGSYPFSGTTSDLASAVPVVGSQEMHLGVVGKNDFDVIIKYLQTLGQTRVLSNPKLAVVNNQEAKIHVGQRQAYITTTTTQTQTSNTVSEAVTYVDVGVQLMVTPTINEDGYVTVKIKPEISSVLSYLNTSSNNKIPIIDTSTAETIVMVKDGTSILIGGLSREEKDDNTTGTPFLSKLPVIGDAFSSKTKKTSRSELLVLITPHIVTGDELVTGYSQDFGNKQDKAYQPYQDFSEEPAGLELKSYQSYPAFGQEKDVMPGLKPARNF
jgi:type II secretory pathway component GspD/PulD (secretin)